MYKNLIIIGSNSSNSINREVGLKIAAKLDATILESSKYDVEIYSMDKETNFPNLINEYMDALRENDNLIFMIPEHNGYLPAFFKNIMDWSSRGKYGMNFLENKNAIIVTVSPGPMGGISLRETYARILKYTGANVKGTIGISGYVLGKNVNKEIDEIIELLK